MKILKVKTKPPYFIVIGGNLISIIAQDLLKNYNIGKVAVITDSKVEAYYGEKFIQDLQSAGIKSILFSFPEGEASKNINTVITLARSLVQKGVDRKDLIIALGGGVVGDIAGFLASIYMRGLPYIQVPTTLLAQVDSSVGGKTGVDLPEGKNLIGTIYQPQGVYIDVQFLKTLPKSELKNGLAEVVKYGCILKRSLFYFLNKCVKTIYDMPPELLEKIIYDSVSIKARVVGADERESGLRRVLNFGHTIGHALEAYSDYKVPHGLAVSVGMAVEAKLSELLGVNEEPIFDSIVRLLEKLELPWRISHLGIKPDFTQIFSYLGKDKKVWKGKLTWVLLKKIGQYIFYEDPPVALIEKAINFCY
ncbi:MAG: 3-dehydroquinate synthase [Caldimicrobium sp.]